MISTIIIIYFNAKWHNFRLFILLFLFLNHQTTTISCLDRADSVRQIWLNSGTLQLLSSAPNSNNQQMQYNLTFTKTFVKPPGIILSLNSYFYCPTTTDITTILEIQDVSITNGHQFSLNIIDFSVSSDTDVLLKINYLVIDSESPYYQIQASNIPTSSMATSYLMSFMRQVNLNSAHVFCYVINFLVYDQPTLADNQVKFTCAIDGYTKVNYTFDSTNSHSPYVPYVYIIVFFVDPDYLSVQSGVFEATTTTDMAIPALPTQPQKTYFIGLHSRKLATNCVKFGLDNNIKLSTNSNVVKVTYSYFILTYNYTYPTDDYYVTIDYRAIENSITFLMWDFPSIWKWQLYYPLIFNNWFTWINSGRAQYFIARMKGELPTQQFNFSYQAQSAIYSFQCNFTVKIIPLDQMIVNSYDNTIEIRILNADSSANETHFTYDRRTSLKNFVKLPNGTIDIVLNFQSVLAGDYFYAYYKNYLSAVTDQNYSYQMILFNVHYINSSTFEKMVNTSVYVHYYADASTHNTIRCDSNHVLGHVFHPVNNRVVTGSFEITQSSWRKPLQYSLIGYNDATFRFHMRFALVTILQVTTNYTSNEIKMIFVNSIGFPLISSKHFIFESPGPAFQSMIYNSTYAEITLDTSNYYGDGFKVRYALTDVYFESIIDTQFYVFKSFVYEDKKNKLNFTFKNTISGVDTNSFFPVFNISSIVVQSIQINQSDIVLVCEFFAYINKEKLTISFPSLSPMYTQRIFLAMESDIEMIYCPYSEQFISRSSLTYLASIILSGLYLAVFIAAIFSCQKMYGIQLMYVIQLSFYSLIPINIICYPFFGLQGLRYSSGATTFFGKLLNIESQNLPNNYQSLGIESNFLSNVNILLIPLFIFPFLFFPLKSLSQKSRDYRIKPRSMKYGRSFLCQVPLTIVLFSAFNICVSFSINIKTYMMSNIGSSLISIFSILLLPTAAALFFKYRNCFSQYNDQFNKNDSIYRLTKHKASQIRGCYPLVLIIEMTLVPIIISIEAVAKYGFYFVLAIEVIVTLFTSIFPLYERKLDNVRNYFHRTIIILIIGLQIYTLKEKQGNPPTDSLVYWTPFVLVGLIALQFLTTGVFIIYKCIDFWRTPGLIDDALRIKQSNIKSKPEQQKPPPRTSSLWIPRNWYDIKKQVKADRMKQRTQYDSIIKSFTPSEKYQMWFNEIGEKKFCNVLGVNQKQYYRLKKSDLVWADKEEYIKSKLVLANVDDLLEDYPNKIITLSDLIEFLDKDLLKKIKRKNELEDK